MVENFEFNKVMRMRHDLGEEWETDHDKLIYSARVKLLRSMVV